MREEAFQKAIESDETIPLSETYDVGATTIDASYEYIQKCRGLHDKDAAETFHRMGCVYASAKQFEKAIESHQKALRVKKVISSQVNENTALSLRYLGTCYDATGNYEKSLEYYRESVQACSDLEKALVLNKMGIVYNKLDKHHQALECYEKAMKIDSITKNKEYSYVLPLMLNNMGNIHFIKREDEKAVLCYKKAFEHGNNLKNSGENSSGALYNLGLIHFRRNSLDKAKKCFFEFIQLNKGNQDAVDVSIVLNNIGNIHCAQGQHDAASESYLMALKIKEDMYGNASPKILGTLSNLSSTYIFMEEYNVAIKALERALDISETDGTNESQIRSAAILNKIGNAFSKKREFTKALKHYLKALKLKRIVYGSSNHPEILLTRHNIGLVLGKAGKYDEAREVLEDVYKRQRQALDPGHAELAKLMLDLGGLHLCKGNDLQATKLSKSAVELFKKHNFSENHPYMKQVRSINERLKHNKTLV